MEEEWRDVKGYEGYYQVSNLGNVRSLERVICNGSTKTARMVKKRQDDKGYHHVNLSKNGKNKTAKVHQLVARAFILNPEGKKWIDHVNTIRIDNRVENLRWVTPKENYHNKLSKDKMSYNNKVFTFLGKIKQNSRKVLEYDLHGKFIKEWLCVRYIIENTSQNDNSPIYACANRKIRHCRDKVYRWKENDNIPHNIETDLSKREIETITERWKEKVYECTDDSLF